MIIWFTWKQETREVMLEPLSTGYVCVQPYMKTKSDERGWGKEKLIKFRQKYR